MKDFFKYVFATVTGLIVIALLCGVMSVVTIVSMVGASTPKIPEKCVLVVHLEGQMEERSEDNPLAKVLGTKAETIGLDQLLRAIDKAKSEDKVRGIYLQAGLLGGASPAMLQELRQKLADFKKTGKFIIAYGDAYTQGAYYVCSVADEVVINPQGVIDWKGLAMQTIYYKDLLDKVGVKMEIFKVGTYKSAVEPYFLNAMSDANREQITTFSREIWQQMLADVGRSRQLPAARLDALADTALTFRPTALYKRARLVDRLAYSDEVPGLIARRMGVKDKDDYNTITAGDLASAAASEPKGTSGDILAVYYAYGTIVDAPTAGLLGESEIAATKVVSDLNDLADNKDVRAVVLRVNSGGGSAYASEQIWRAIQNIKRSGKPVIVSMGGMAASGGYYISCGADCIVAEPTTLTGSIGIFGAFPVAGELLNDKLGIHSQTVKTNRYADIGDLTREMNDGERQVIQQYINRGYELFTRRCADGRNMPQERIKAIAEGRVWTGEHAKTIGLVDELGSLDRAIAIAKKKAHLSDCTVIDYPEQSDFLTTLLESDKSGTYADAALRQTLGDTYGTYVTLRRMATRRGAQAALPYTVLYNL